MVGPGRERQTRGYLGKPSCEGGRSDRVASRIPGRPVDASVGSLAGCDDRARVALLYASVGGAKEPGVEHGADDLPVTELWHQEQPEVRFVPHGEQRHRTLPVLAAVPMRQHLREL